MVCPPIRFPQNRRAPLRLPLVVACRPAAGLWSRSAGGYEQGGPHKVFPTLTHPRGQLPG
jgi:hypothetical protein